MTIGSLVVKLLIRESFSLKDKRRIVKSIKDNIRNDFNAAVAEVDCLDCRQEAVLAIVTVGNDSRFVSSVLSNIINRVRSFPVELIDQSQELL
ncbi:MAG: DUF503 domain-containing protein [Planctomycetota bacterium]